MLQALSLIVLASRDWSQRAMIFNFSPAGLTAAEEPVWNSDVGLGIV